MSENTDTRTASQKIQDLEKVVTMLYQAAAENKNVLENLLRQATDLPLIKDALQLLNKKTEAIIQAAAPETGITPANVSNLVVKANVVDLTAQVAAYVANGHLVPTDTVVDGAYLVCEESNAEGVLLNPRIQFRLDSQPAATQEALKGKKVGEAVLLSEDKFSVKLLEVYLITQPKAPEAAQVAEMLAEAPPVPANIPVIDSAPAVEATPTAETTVASEAATA